MNDKSTMYHNKINKEINNNELIYTSYGSNPNTIKWNNEDIRKKINNIINDNNFIYSKLVNIVIENEIIKKKIIGIDNNYLITIDNESIPLDSIKDIYI